MSSLLIALLGPERSDSGPSPVRYRLPGGERIVETHVLAVELASALQCNKLHLVGPPGGAFHRLLDLLPADARLDPVPERVAVPQTTPTEAAETPPESEGQDAPEPSPDGVETLSGESAAPGPDSEPAAPLEENLPEATAEAAAEPPQEVPPQEVPVLHHQPDLRSLEDRIRAQVSERHPDRDALAALAERLQQQLGLAEVRCELVSMPSEGRSILAALRSLVALPEQGDLVHFDVTGSSRTFPMLGVLAMHYLRELRPDVRCGSIHDGGDGEGDGVRPVHFLDTALEILDWIGAFRGLARGGAPAALHQLFGQDRRLQRLAGPYVRFQRGVAFGALSEVLQGASLIRENQTKLGRLPHTHPFQLFGSVLSDSMAPYLQEAPNSQHQLALGERALHEGGLPAAALHVREALISACLEAYDRNPTRSWIDVPQSGGAQQVRPRDVAGFILSTDAARAHCPDLETCWSLLATARNRYVNYTPTMVPAGQLKDQDHEVHRCLEWARQIIGSQRLAGLPEVLNWDQAVKHSIDLRALRPREGRKTKGGRKGPPGGTRGDGTRGDGNREGGEKRPPRQGDAGPRRDRGEGGARGRRDRNGGPPRGGRDGGAPRRERDGQPRDRDAEPPRRDREPRPDPGDSTPRVTSTRGGLGNFGIALAQAGLSPSGAKRSEAHPERTPAKEDPRKNESVVESATPAPPPPPTPPAPDNPTSTSTPFDVAGPGPLEETP